ncbi:MAG TPA: extracellular solute-binding protein [Methylobacterium sp.]|uniref:extracellular solute-binding protein n=1 Tax=Methylorubrum sp. B1-46 TaxID=2897334 RepID=UPI001E3F6A3F|nr:extracellular solute-binding protein [Methylorubrum sp. B1-46]UGB26473.1 extracellular solute-binding protein [Methylorubrum sp. B1-46]HEV2543022.1 extracellular solute-binding protein [Methylobacterium sp.]
MSADATRRSIVLGTGALALASTLPRSPRAEGSRPVPGKAHGEIHGLSSFGELKYAPDFSNFDYVNPMAPRGGRFSTQIVQTFGNQAFDTFDTLNPYVFRGTGAAGINLTFDSLMVRALDEPDALYGLVARSVETSADGLTYRFALRPQARFHDGSPLTARDAAFSLTILKEKGHPTIAQVIRDVAEATAEGNETLVVRFASGRSRDLPLIVAGLPIFSAKFFEGRDFEAQTLQPLLGSGAYQVGRIDIGRFIELERVSDYWAADLPVMVGQNNFDQIRYEYFRDRQVAFEAFKGGAYTYRQEFTSRIWATGYDFPAAREGRVKRETLPDTSPAAIQGWFFNTRREVFKDPRVREAIGLCFDFPWTNRTAMFGAYERTVSFFQKTDLMATGKPSPEELALLEPFSGQVPAEVFGEAWMPPVPDGSGQDRALLARAVALLKEAGCTREGGALRLPGGKPIEFEFLDSDSVWEPIVQPFIRNLGLIGIKARQRVVDAAQYQARVRDFDFDITARAASGDATPGPELREAYGSRAAAIPGSNNLAGISDPVIDALLDSIANADSRASLTVACRALDRVLRTGRYWISMWYSPEYRLALWDMFGRPAKLPTYGLGVPALWWYDEQKARRIGRG